MARHLVLAAVADTATDLVHPLRSDDTTHMVALLRALGCAVDDTTDDRWRLTPRAVDPGPARAIDVGLAGTVMRFGPPLAALVPGRTTFDGTLRARQRPMRGLVDALRQLGAEVSATDGGLPIVVASRGRIAGGAADVDTGASSQFLSGLLLSACRFERGTRLRAVGGLPSLPHVDMTLALLARHGVEAGLVDGVYVVEPGTPTGGTVVVEPDLSNAAPFLAAALVTGGRVTVPAWPATTTQPGDDLRRLLVALGAQVEHTAEGLVVTGTGTVHGLGRVDLGHAGELTPVLTALAVLADGPTEFTGIAHLRGHESDRLAALSRELTRLGGDVAETADGVRIRPRPLHGGTVDVHGDHRLVSMAAVLGLVVPGIVVDDVQAAAKTMPDFPARWAGMLA
jgi:3-phosphoshikimate 1-carboxyvinyltransferase